MLIDAQHRYAHPVEAVMAAFRDPDFYRAKFTAVGARNIEVVSSERGEDSFTIVIKREVPLDVPGALRGFLNAWNSIRQRDHWEAAGDEFVNEIEITAVGVPVDLRGSMVLRAHGEGCINDVQMEVTSGVPLLGKALVDFVAQNTRRGLDDELRVITDYLAAR